MEISLGDIFGTKKREAQKVTQDKAERDRVNQEHKDSRLQTLQEKRDKWTNKGLEGTENTYVEEIRQKGTINGQAIGMIEKRMRPGEYSQGGFLNSMEKLADVLERDQQHVNELGLTHAEIVDPLQRVMFAAIEKEATGREFEWEYNDRNYNVNWSVTRGFQASPFFNKETGGSQLHYMDGTAASGEIELEDKEIGKKLEFSPMLVHLIRDYGFYEGDVPYRLGPDEIVEFFGLKK